MRPTAIGPGAAKRQRDERMQTAESTPSKSVQVEVPLRVSRQELMASVGMDDLVEDFVGPVNHLFATVGKGLRGATVMRSASVGMHPLDPAVRESAIAVELLHLGTLVHDDVVDDGRLRRDAETVGMRYGNQTSGFVGALLVSRALEIIASRGTEPIRRSVDTATAMCAGQMAEFEDLFDIERSVSRYRFAIAGKTASLFEFAAWLGAWVSRADRQTVEAMSRFGRELGVAFQILDDVLDLTAPLSVTGKRQGNDLRQGVYSLPIIYAIEADAALRGMLGRSAEEDLPSLVARIERSGGINRAIQECRSSAGRAGAALRDDCISVAAAEGLTALLDEALAPMTALTHA